MDIPVTYEMCGRKFVADADFLDLFDGIDQNVRSDAESALEMLGRNVAELRAHESLVQGLVDRCLNMRQSLYAPVVTKDWVFWVPAGQHNNLMRMLARLYSKGQFSDQDYVLRQGIGWHISTMNPSTIHVGSKYKATQEDKEIFSAFTLNTVY